MSNSLFTVQRCKFNNQFQSKFTNAFEDWFVDLARLLHPNGDIQSLRLTQGDGKIDVYVISEQLVYQCYGPQAWKASEASAKIETDFWGAHTFLKGNLKKWVFVHNHPTGRLDKNCIGALNAVSAKCEKDGNQVVIEAWGIEEIWETLENTVPLAKLQNKFGAADPVSFDFATIEGLLNSLQRAELPYDAEPLSQPSVNKLHFNNLGPAYQREIREGRNGIGQIEKYFESWSSRNPEFPEQMAEYFRKRYAHIESRTLPADDIYEQLRLNAGWSRMPNAKLEMATRSILAYFFESCDIFKNPAEEAVAQ